MCAEVLGILDKVNEIPNQPQTGVSRANTVWDPCNFHQRVYLLQGSHTAPAPYTKSIQQSSGAAQSVTDTPLYPAPATVHPKQAGPRTCGAAQTLNATPLCAVPVAVHPKPAGPRSWGREWEEGNGLWGRGGGRKWKRRGDGGGGKGLAGRGMVGRKGARPPWDQEYSKRFSEKQNMADARWKKVPKSGFVSRCFPAGQ